MASLICSLKCESKVINVSLSTCASYVLANKVTCASYVLANKVTCASYVVANKVTQVKVNVGFSLSNFNMVNPHLEENAQCKDSVLLISFK